VKDGGRGRGGRKGGVGRKRSDGRRPKAGKGRGKPASRGSAVELSDPRILAALRGSDGRSAQEIGRSLRLDGSEQRSLRRRLNRLEADGRIARVGKRYRIARSDGLVEGVLRAAPDGSALRVESDGIVWRVEEVGDGRPGDRVVLQPRAEDGSGRAGDVLQVLEGHRDHWVGILATRGRRGRVTPYRDDALWGVAIPEGQLGDARSGDVVRVEASGRRRDGVPVGTITQVFGRPGEPDADSAAVIWRHRLPVAFPPSVESAVSALPDRLDPGELERRVDLRDRPFLTIDPASARDHDDAVCVSSGRGSDVLQVAIADVSHYVARDSDLDREALRRGNSVYFPDRAIPMLPERLSAGLCSLREGEDRLVLVAELEVARGGQVARRSFYPAVIRSCARLAYEEAARVMEGAPAPALGTAVVEQLRDLDRVARALVRRRRAGGALDLDLPEVEVVHDATGAPVDLIERARSCAHRAIEEAMLAANRAVAGVLLAAEIPCIFRNHEPPLETDAENLLEVLSGLGLVGAGDRLSPHIISRALERAAGRPVERLVNRTVLRSLRQARYGAVNQGHFALAFDHYVHFTSPIRRYADLEVHRALGDWLDRARRPGGRRLASVAGRLSWRERVAVSAERETVDLAKCAVMQRHLGETLDGTVTGVAKQGLYVTPDAPRAEGLVHISNLPGYFSLDAHETALVARRSRLRFGLGDRLRVQVDRVDQLKAHINFSIAPEAKRPRGPRQSAPSQSARRS
jgi:ribonuclease R